MKIAQPGPEAETLVELLLRRERESQGAWTHRERAFVMATRIDTNFCRVVNERDELRQRIEKLEEIVARQEKQIRTLTTRSFTRRP